MLHPSTKRLIDKLNEMTRKQRVTWTEGENATVVHDTEGYRVVLTAEPHAVLLTDALGREIETCLPEEFADEVDGLGRPYSKFISELYREAHRHARGTEKAISALLAVLDSEDVAAAPVAAAMVVVDTPHAATDETTPLGSETEITAAVANLADQINGTPADVPAEPQVEIAPAPAEPEPVQASEVIVEPELLPEPIAEAVVEAAPEPELAAEVIEETPTTSEPGSFGTFGDFLQETAVPEPAPQEAPEPGPEPEPEILVAAPEPEPVPEPAREPVQAAEEILPAAAPLPTTPTLAQPISLSSIPFGFGLGAAQRAGSPSHPSTTPPQPEPVRSADAPARLVIDGTLDLPDQMPDAFEDTVSADSYPPAAPEAGPLDLPGESAPVMPEPGNPRRFNPWN